MKSASLRASLLWMGGLVACGGSQSDSQSPDDAFDRTLEGVDDTRCEFRGRKDRIAVLTKGRGAKGENVRRVYAVGDEKDGRRVLRCREVDTNLDGAKDVVRTYDEAGQAELEQADADYDGKIDTWLEFRGGMVSRAQYDTNDDGKPDEFMTYSGGRLARVQRDFTLDGEIDTWEVYQGGRLRRIGRDVDGDQRVDEWYRDETPSASAAPSASAPSTAPGTESGRAVPAPAGTATPTSTSRPGIAPTSTSDPSSPPPTHGGSKVESAASARPAGTR